MPAHRCIVCPENLGCCICFKHSHEEGFAEAAYVFQEAAALLVGDMEDTHLPALAEAQDSFRLSTAILEREVEDILYPQGEILYARIRDEEYMLTPTRLLAEPVPQEDEKRVLLTLWDLLVIED